MESRKKQITHVDGGAEAWALGKKFCCNQRYFGIRLLEALRQNIYQK